MHMHMYYMYACTHVCTYMYVYVYMHMCMHICVCVCMHACMYVYVYVHVYVCACMHSTYVYVVGMCICAYVCDACVCMIMHDDAWRRARVHDDQCMVDVIIVRA